MAQATRSRSQDATVQPHLSAVGDLAAFGIDDSRLVVGNLELALSERQVFAAGQRAHVTRREFDVLYAMALCHGHVVARKRLYEHVWGRPMPHARDRSVDTHVNHIRHRLRAAAPEWGYIHHSFRSRLPARACAGLAGPRARESEMKYVLFVCTHNAGRSQMAHAFFERYAPDDIRAESAGQQPADRVWPEVVEVMREVGIDLSDRRPQKLTVEMQLHADWAITLACGATCPYVPTTVEDWDIPDPAGQPIEEVRSIRDAVELRVKELIEQRLDAIRSDRTAHQLRLQRLLPDLAKEFEGIRSDAEIRTCADAILADYQDANVRSFVMSIAHRRTRDCLRAEHCDALATAG